MRDRGHSTARSIGKRLLPLPSGPARNLSESRSISTLIRSSRSASRATKRWSSYLPPDETEPLHTPLMNHGVCGGGGSGKGSSRPQNLPVAPWEADTGILQATHKNARTRDAAVPSNQPTNALSPRVRCVVKRHRQAFARPEAGSIRSSAVAVKRGRTHSPGPFGCLAVR